MKQRKEIIFFRNAERNLVNRELREVGRLLLINISRRGKNENSGSEENR